MTAGSIRRRCRCRDENGKDLGSTCPKLAQRNHGAWQLRHELPATKDGKRRTFRRDGYAVKSAAPDVRDTQPGAQDDLDRLRELLNLGKDENEQDAVATLLDSLGRKEPIPTVDEVRKKIRAGLALSEKGTVGQWLDVWIAQKEKLCEQGKLRRATFVTYESHVRLYLKPKLGHVRRDRLNVADGIEMFNSVEDDNDKIESANSDRDDMVARIRCTHNRAAKRALKEQLTTMLPYRRPVGLNSQKRILSALSKSLDDGIAQQMFAMNIATFIKIPAKRHKPVIWTADRIEQWRLTGKRPAVVMVWTPEQAGTFMDYVAEHDQEREALWHLLLYRGPRRGEVAGLPWTEVNLGAKTIKITTQLTEIKYQVEEGAPKSEAGDRTIAIDDEAVRLLKELRAWQAAERLRLGPAWQASGRVFTKPDGSPLRPSWIADQFERLYKGAGLPPIRLHDLRHTAATLMLAAKIDMKIVQETLGHSTLATTSDIYTSVLPKIAEEAASAALAIVPRRGRSDKPEPLGHPSGTHQVVELDSRRTGTT